MTHQQSSFRPVWLQAIARLLYLVGYTTLQFYLPLVFVNQLGLAATTVGLALAVGSLAGVVGHLLGGYLADSPQYGRKRALLFSAILIMLAATLLLVSQSFLALVFANILMGLSAGCYWTAADAAVVDATGTEQRQMAFALLVLADSLGTGIGIWGGGILLDQHQHAPTLFGASLVPLLLFWGLTQSAMAETVQGHPEAQQTLKGFAIALRDRSLLLFITVNILFTTYLALVNSTLPLYLSRLVPTAVSPAAASLSLSSISTLFTWGYIGLGVVLQIPIVRLLNRLLKTRALMLSILLWGGGFVLVWATPVNEFMQPVVVIALAVLSIAGGIYKPFAPAMVAEFAPASRRGIYLAMSYQCWSIGYFIGPLLGGWAIDQSGATAHNIWLGAAASTIPGVIGLGILSRWAIALPEATSLAAEPMVSE